MIKPKGKPAKIAKAVLKGKGIKAGPSGERNEKLRITGPYLQHQENMDKKRDKTCKFDAKTMREKK